jgi:hypothetical protein
MLCIFCEYIVRLCEQYCPAFEIVKVLEVVINHYIGIDDAFITTKYNLLPRDERKVIMKP